MAKLNLYNAVEKINSFGKEAIFLFLLKEMSKE